MSFAPVTMERSISPEGRKRSLSVAGGGPESTAKRSKSPDTDSVGRKKRSLSEAGGGPESLAKRSKSPSTESVSGRKRGSSEMGDGPEPAAKRSKSPGTESVRVKTLFRVEKDAEYERVLRRANMARQVSGSFDETDIDVRRRGFANVAGFTCYRNSVLQAVFQCPKVVNWYLQYHGSDNCIAANSETCVSCHIRALIELYFSTETKSSGFTKKLEAFNKLVKQKGWTPSGQNGQGDPQEHLGWLFEQQAKEAAAGDIEIFDALTKIVTRSNVTCPGCGHVIPGPDAEESVLSLPIRPRAADLQTYLKNYMSEIISDYKCSNCSRISDCRREYKIISAPAVLQVQLKQFDIPGCRAKKDDGRVIYSDLLDLVDSADRQFIGDFTYALKSVVLHRGGDNSGHYIAYAKSLDNEWHSFDDTKVRSLQNDQYLNPPAVWKPYLFFYERIEASAILDDENHQAASMASASPKPAKQVVKKKTACDVEIPPKSDMAAKACDIPVTSIEAGETRPNTQFKSSKSKIPTVTVAKSKPASKKSVAGPTSVPEVVSARDIKKVSKKVSTSATQETSISRSSVKKTSPCRVQKPSPVKSRKPLVTKTVCKPAAVKSPKERVTAKIPKQPVPRTKKAGTPAVELKASSFALQRPAPKEKWPLRATMKKSKSAPSKAKSQEPQK